MHLPDDEEFWFTCHCGKDQKLPEFFDPFTATFFCAGCSAKITIAYHHQKFIAEARSKLHHYWTHNTKPEEDEDSS